MNRFVATLAVLALSATPAAALSLTAAQVGDIYCASRLSGDMAPVMAILTPGLAQLVAAHLPESADPATAIPWQSQPDYANGCMPVGAAGTYDLPEVVLSFSYLDPSKAGYSDRLVVRFVDKRLRLDDIEYPDGTTLRDRLEAMP
jgi:hypothetical protein